MTELKYNKNGNVIFTRKMAKEYTILAPMMLPVTAKILTKLMEFEIGYKEIVLLTNQDRSVIETGLKYVHNDMCYPAILCIGQLIEAVESGRYDRNKVALMITQSGGGCRASNYLHLLRKALHRAGLNDIPVVSLNLSGLDKQPGFRITLSLARKAVFAMMYGDIIVHVANQCRPYEIHSGDTDALVDTWTETIVSMFSRGEGIWFSSMRETMIKIIGDFKQIPCDRTVEKPRVGIVGEIYVKYSPFGNNNLESFLLKEGAEVVVPGVTDFMLFKGNNRSVDIELYGGNILKKTAMGIYQWFICKCQDIMIDVIKSDGTFRPMAQFSALQEMVKGYLGKGNKMGEGWLLTAEMLELIHTGTNNVICTQPFGCLPNHVAGKGMMRKIKDDYPNSNIVAIDYDPGATRINQENRIKLMLANASRLTSQTTGKK